MSKKHILIAEDEKPIANVLKAKLEDAGYAVQVAYNGEEAIKRVEEGGVDLLLLDLIMPIKDGFSVLEYLKEREIDIPVIVSTNLSQEEDALHAEKLGAVQFIVKADTPLVEIVEQVGTTLGK